MCVVWKPETLIRRNMLRPNPPESSQHPVIPNSVPTNHKFPSRALNKIVWIQSRPFGLKLPWFDSSAITIAGRAHHHPRSDVWCSM